MTKQELLCCFYCMLVADNFRDRGVFCPAHIEQVASQLLTFLWPRNMGLEIWIGQLVKDRAFSYLLRKPELMRGSILSVPKWRGEGTLREIKFSKEGRQSAAPGIEKASACPPAAPGQRA